MDLSNLPMILLLIFGFGFIVFFHELGHFIAAKWADVKVEQFAIGFGQALISWRKGVGTTWGNTQRKMEQLREAASAAGKPAPVFGDTEYRINWMPLGGYVKMLGQDDLAPNAGADDPRAYNMKPVGKRMVIVSAGVVMNIILALFGFFALYLYGFSDTPCVAGNVQCGSPAQHAGIQVGDRIISFDGKELVGFDKLVMHVALVREGPVPVVVRRPGVDHDIELTVTPAHSDTDPRGLSLIGVQPSVEMRSPNDAKKPYTAKEIAQMQDLPAEARELQPGEAITAVEGAPVDPKTDYFKLDQALQTSGGKPVPVTITAADGKQRPFLITPRLGEPFDNSVHYFAGLEPRAQVSTLLEDCLLRGQVQPGDIVQGIDISDNAPSDVKDPGVATIRARTDAAGQAGNAIVLTLLRNGTQLKTKPVVPTLSLGGGKHGLGLGLVHDEAHPIIGDVDSDSTAAAANVTPGATIRSLDGKPVSNWFDVHSILAACTAGSKVKLVTDKGTFDLNLTDHDVQGATDCRYVTDASELWKPLIEIRRTANILTAARWGTDETRELLNEAYLTLHRMVSGRLSPRTISGPIGIFHAGTQVADRGIDWMLWFLSMISVNLAVVNFLPIPIVDGGLFVFLIIEKLQRRPISPMVQTVAQVVGLALIVTVFLFVSYSDVMRWTQR